MTNRQKRNRERRQQHFAQKAAEFCAVKIVKAIAWKVSKPFLADRRRSGLVIDIHDGRSYTVRSNRHGEQYLQPIVAEHPKPRPAA